MQGFNHFGEAGDALHEAMAQVIKKAAFDIQANAQAGAPVDTGFLKSSIYTVTSDSSTYGQADTPPGDSSLLPPVEPPPDDLTAFIGVGANYGIYQEFGTRFMPPQPYLAPAVEQERPAFEAAAGAIEAKMKELM